MATNKSKFILSKNLLWEIRDDFKEIYFNGADHTQTLLGDNRDDAEQRIIEFFHSKATDILSSVLMAENVLVLAGAGASMADGGPDRKILWNNVKTKLGEDKLKEIKEKLKLPEDFEDVEALLSKIELFLDLHLSDELIGPAKLTILDSVIEACSLKNEAEHHQKFLKALLSASSRANSSRAKIFTTNYDMQFETAAQKIGAILFDGFSFHSAPRFDGKYFDYDLVVRKGSRVPEADNFISNVIHLYKLHGSLDWVYDGKKGDVDRSVIKKLVPDDKDERVLIYPSRNKFERSYARPYFELMSRFQAELRKKSPTTLFIIGYGFCDEHINSMIREAVVQQQNLRVVIINGTIDKQDNEMITFLKTKGIAMGTTCFLNLKFAEKIGTTEKIKTLVDLIPSMDAFRQVLNVA